MHRSPVTFFVVMLLGLFYHQSSLAQGTAEDIVIGQHLQVESRVLGETRDILVSVPVGYERSQERYPVLYLLDGEAHFRHGSAVAHYLAAVQRLPRVIVVAITNSDRTRDLTPMHVDHRPSSGGAEKFMTFMETELFPLIAQRYRTTSQRILVGHSLGGMFAAYTLLTRPAMFQIYVAISPTEPASPQGTEAGGRYLLDLAGKAADNDPRLKGLLFITVGDREGEPAMRYARELSDILSRKSTQALRVTCDVMPGEDHRSLVLRAMYNGLEAAYQRMQLPLSVAEQGPEAVVKYYEELASRAEYESSMREEWINLAGYQLLQQGKVDRAIDMFTLNTRLFPRSANVYDSLGEAFERSGQLTPARDNYRQAYAIGEREQHPATEIFKANLERIEQQMSQSR